MRAHSRKRPALITSTLMVAYESFVCIMPCLDYSGLRIMSTDMEITPALCQFNRVFQSFAWPASMQISWNKRKCLHKKRVQLPEELVRDTNMAAVSLFWDTNMAAVYGVHYYSKHFEHIFDFLTPFSRPGGQIPQSRITSCKNTL